MSRLASVAAVSDAWSSARSSYACWRRAWVDTRSLMSCATMMQPMMVVSPLRVSVRGVRRQRNERPCGEVHSVVPCVISPATTRLYAS